MARGVAADTLETREFLNGCGGIERIMELDGFLSFQYDPSQRPAEVPAGVYFDLAEAPF